MNFPAESEASPEPAIETTVDGFYAGRFHLLQPKRRGFRAGLDSLLLAASLPATRQGPAADLGAGAGAAGLAAAVRCPGLRISLIENDSLMAELARRSVALPGNAALAARLTVVEADLLGGRAARLAAGLADGGFRTVLTNPPFHPAGGRRSPDALRDAARAVRGPRFLTEWIRTAAALLETGGLFAMIARPDGLEDILSAAANRLGDLRIVPVHSRAGHPAIRILVHARKGSRAMLSLLPPVVLNDAGGQATPLSRAIATGEAAIDLGLG